MRRCSRPPCSARGRQRALRQILVGELGVGDGDLADEAPEDDLGVARRRGRPRLELGVDHRVDGADEHAWHTGHAADRSPAPGTGFEAGHVRLEPLAASGAGEEERDVDVDPLARELLDRRDPLGRRRDLEHQILALEPPETASLPERGGRVIRKARRDFHADVPVASIRGVVHGAQDVGSLLDLLDGDLLVEGGGRRVLEAHMAIKRGVVAGRACDGSLEDGGVRGGAAPAVVPHQARELAARQEIAPHVIEPDRRSVLLELLHVHGNSFHRYRLESPRGDAPAVEIRVDRAVGSEGFGSCQSPPEAKSGSASAGPQLPGWYA
jgi:hypothetical protein